MKSRGLRKIRFGLIDGIRALGKKRGVGGAAAEDIEDMLIAADIGTGASSKILSGVRAGISEDALLPELKNRMLGIFEGRERNLNLNSSGPTVIMITGVNGTGKTTTAGKLARLLVDRGMKVLLAASDTFRAGAVEQLEIWADRAGAGFVGHKRSSDPSAVAYDAAEAALARGVDFLLVDTAGRLHTRVNLMQELKKIKGVLGKKIPGAPHEIMLVLDATIGQNAVSQADIFLDAVGVTSIGLTKLDGTAKGGIILAIEDELGIPVKLIGTGESIEDMDFFNPDEFVESLLSG